jgi:hypothetical protein
MIFNGVTGLAADAGQEGREVAAVEFHGRAALAADDVVAMASVGQGVAVTTILGVDAAHKTHLGQEVEGAIDGDQTEGGAVLAGAQVHLGRAGVASALVQGADHGLPWPGDAVTRLAQLMGNVFL